MDTTRTTLKKPRVSLDRSIERLRKQLADFAPYLGKGKPTRSLEEFDLETERLIADLLGETSELLEAYEYAELGEAAGLVNMPDEAPEGTGMDSLRQSLLQRSRVLETCISELEARRSDEPKKHKTGRQVLTGPQVAEHMSFEIRNVSHDASLREAGRLMQQWKLGSLLVTDQQSYVGFITDSILASEVVGKGLDPNTTVVKTCMRTPVVAIAGDRPIIDAVRLMKEQATRHLAVTQDGAIIGVISVSNILRYYSGVV
ncbi:MAG: CBS domain-containing protein [Nitrospirae bacterium]|nr:CBS domain-containing protein [Nitrospirota bacterium]MBU6478938.1 CBS domain-containing protein [Nitrospirota bacterium]MDE3039244.1 CBS domain-containing protein [Nitrospirota bacterium]MDE3051155.1 CBS domain-containing protein [Nitrospirota bacterium]